MNKKIFIVVMCMLVLCGCSNNNKRDELAKIGEVQDIQESNKKIPEFTIVLMGLMEDTITESDLKDIKLYDFVADVTAYDIDPDSDVYREKWTGVKLTDVLEKKGIKEYDTLDFRATGDLTVRYKKTEIDDSLYLVFYRDDLLLSDSEETPVMLFSTTLKNRFWVPSLTRIDIM